MEDSTAKEIVMQLMKMNQKLDKLFDQLENARKKLVENQNLPLIGSAGDVCSCGQSCNCKCNHSQK